MGCDRLIQLVLIGFRDGVRTQALGNVEGISAISRNTPFNCDSTACASASSTAIRARWATRLTSSSVSAIEHRKTT